MNQVLDEAGYTSVVATNCDQAYQRYLKLGEQLSVRARLLDVTGPKRTALGEGWFVTTRSTWFSANEPVATMDFRILKFRRRPPQPQPPHLRPAPPPSPDAPVGHPRHRVLLGRHRRRRAAHPALRRLRRVAPPARADVPGLRPPGDGGYVVAAGTGEVFSYVVHHHPPVPGKQLPMVVALVQLPEGVRMVGEMPGVAPGPGADRAAGAGHLHPRSTTI